MIIKTIVSNNNRKINNDIMCLYLTAKSNEELECDEYQEKVINFRPKFQIAGSAWKWRRKSYTYYFIILLVLKETALQLD